MHKCYFYILQYIHFLLLPISYHCNYEQKHFLSAKLFLGFLFPNSLGIIYFNLLIILPKKLRRECKLISIINTFNRWVGRTIQGGLFNISSKIVHQLRYYLAFGLENWGGEPFVFTFNQYIVPYIELLFWYKNFFFVSRRFNPNAFLQL